MSLLQIQAEIHSDYENERIKTELRQHARTNFYWIGLNDQQYEGNYYWTYSGSPASYFDWGANQPGGFDDCVLMYRNDFFGDMYSWYDATCSEYYIPLCEVGTQN